MILEKKDLKFQNILNTVNSFFNFNFLISLGQDWGSCYRFLSGGRGVVPKPVISKLYQVLTDGTDDAQKAISSSGAKSTLSSLPQERNQRFCAD